MQGEAEHDSHCALHLGENIARVDSLNFGIEFGNKDVGRFIYDGLKENLLRIEVVQNGLFGEVQLACERIQRGSIDTGRAKRLQRRSEDAFACAHSGDLSDTALSPTNW